ncbi:MAG: response regulator [Candidatus Sungbacteria bacterium]|nr:response regulator [Candidatus Sungbacteria bacterium]
MEPADKKHILLVEDDVFMIDLLANELTLAGFEVTIAKTGKEGVEKYDEAKPDLMILDILLPDQDGFETLRQIRRKPGGIDAKVIILSNIAEGPNIDEAKRLGALEYLIKANLSLADIVVKAKNALALTDAAK